MSGEFQIPASRQAVWEALNDPEILKQTIPGCESIEQVSDTEMTGAVTAKVGPVKATFKGNVTLSDVDAPNSYVLTGQGKGGAAGFAKGSAHVSLSDSGGGTLLRYQVNASVGGKLAQLGSRIIDSFARKMADQFFEKFQAEVEGATPAAAEAAASEDEAPKKGWLRRLVGA